LNTVLVTGATGFTGSHLARRLVEEGRDVVALVRPTSRVDGLQAAGVDCRESNLQDLDSVRACLADVSHVYHLAAAFRTEHADSGEFYRTNVIGTRHLLEAARDVGVRRFVHCSTVGIHGEIEDPPASESYRFKPGDYYQHTKLEGEQAALAYAHRGLAVSIVRPVGIYGPDDKRFLKLFKAISSGRFVMIGSGRTLYHMTYVEDLVDGLLLAGEVPAAVGDVFIMAGEEYTTLRRLVDLISDVLGVPHPRLRIPYAPVYAASVACDRLFKILRASPPLYPRRVEFFAKDRAFDITKAKELLGYRPKVRLSEGLAKTAAWYREKGLL
jgi:nucleoside-diphosphate-sugar epimerase